MFVYIYTVVCHAGISTILHIPRALRGSGRGGAARVGAVGTVEAAGAAAAGPAGEEKRSVHARRRRGVVGDCAAARSCLGACIYRRHV